MITFAVQPAAIVPSVVQSRQNLSIISLSYVARLRLYYLEKVIKHRWGSRRDTIIRKEDSFTGPRSLAQPVISPNLYYNVYEHNSLGSPGN